MFLKTKTSNKKLLFKNFDFTNDYSKKFLKNQELFFAFNKYISKYDQN